MRRLRSGSSSVRAVLSSAREEESREVRVDRRRSLFLQQRPAVSGRLAVCSTFSFLLSPALYSAPTFLSGQSTSRGVIHGARRYPLGRSPGAWGRCQRAQIQTPAPSGQQSIARVTPTRTAARKQLGSRYLVRIWPSLAYASQASLSAHSAESARRSYSPHRGRQPGRQSREPMPHNPFPTGGNGDRSAVFYTAGHRFESCRACWAKTPAKKG